MEEEGFILGASLPWTKLRSRAAHAHMPEIIVDIQHIGQQRLGWSLFEFQLFHAIAQHDCFARNLLSGSAHPQKPGQPVEEHAFDLRVQQCGFQLIIVPNVYEFSNSDVLFVSIGKIMRTTMHFLQD